MSNSESGSPTSHNGAVTPGSYQPGTFQPTTQGPEEALDQEFEDLLKQENLETLPADNKLAVKALLKMQRALAVKDVRSEKEIRLITAGLKKPATFSPSTITIRQFIFVYEAYADAMGLTETAAIKGFISF